MNDLRGFSYNYFSIQQKKTQDGKGETGEAKTYAVKKEQGELVSHKKKSAVRQRGRSLKHKETAAGKT